MSWLIVVVVALLLIGAVLAMSEASISRMSRVRAISLHEEGRRNAALLEQLEEDPAKYLNSVYLSALFVQNASAILVAMITESYIGGIWVTVASILFTVAYFVTVEAMSKTYAILNNDRVALALTPVVWSLSRILSAPTGVLIGIANWLLPGKGLEQGPFVSENDIRSMADVGHEEGAIEEQEKELIHSIFEFGDTVAREVMVPRPDMIVVASIDTLQDVMDTVIRRSKSRVPVFEGSLDNIVGIVYAKDLMRGFQGADYGWREKKASDVMRRALFVPESKRVAELLTEMQQSKTHMAIVVDEYGGTAGLVTLEDLIEEIVGEIADEFDREEPSVEPVDEDTMRVNGRFDIDELADILDVELPNTEWDTVGGLVSGLLGRMPAPGDEATFQRLNFKVERTQGRRIVKVLVTRMPDSEVEVVGEE